MSSDCLPLSPCRSATRVARCDVHCTRAQSARSGTARKTRDLRLSVERHEGCLSRLLDASPGVHPCNWRRSPHEVRAALLTWRWRDDGLESRKLVPLLPTQALPPGVPPAGHLQRSEGQPARQRRVAVCGRQTVRVPGLGPPQCPEPRGADSPPDAAVVVTGDASHPSVSGVTGQPVPPGFRERRRSLKSRPFRSGPGLAATGTGDALVSGSRLPPAPTARPRRWTPARLKKLKPRPGPTLRARHPLKGWAPSDNMIRAEHGLPLHQDSSGMRPGNNRSLRMFEQGPDNRNFFPRMSGQPPPIGKMLNDLEG
ncbi:conserved domain protein [Myxococcus xanthus DK 1622]|uniref:Conserved domain protein n=2 Tax=Myxococcaceae TaxID=31 RepID=Q1DFT3_MYXXD|nr:conserved domain protein [Myxococcus xanthus DK 1622]